MDYSMIAPQARKEVEEQAAPPPAQPPPCEEFAHYYRPVGPYMNGYVSQVDQLSRIRRLNSIELTQSKRSMSLRMNFRDYMDDDIDDHYYSGYGPPPVPHGMHHYPPPAYLEPAPRAIPRGLPPPPPPLGPPRPRYMTQGPPPPLPPPPYHGQLPPPHHGPPPHWPERPGAPSPVGYPPSNYFCDENPNGCMVM